MGRLGNGLVTPWPPAFVGPAALHGTDVWSGWDPFMERDTSFSTQPSSALPQLVLGRLFLLLIPGLGFFIAWYCFHVADARCSTSVTRTFLRGGQFLSLFLVLVFLTGLVIGLLLPVFRQPGGG